MIKVIPFSEDDLKNLNDALALDWPSKVKRKLLALKMMAEGVHNDVIARVLDITARSVNNYRNEFIEGGIESTVEDRAYRPVSSVEPFLNCLRCFFLVHPVASAKEGAYHIQRLTGIKLSEDQARRIMKRLGLKYCKSGQIPGKADPQLQFEFLENELLPRLKEANEGKRSVYFVDAVHFVMGAFLGMLWCLTRVFTRTASGRKRYNVLGAINSHNHNLITVTNDSYINGASVCELLRKLRKAHVDSPITVVLDNARYQKCEVVRVLAEQLDIELLYLPPYSPNLNIIERLWKFVKKDCLYNKFYPEFGAFKAAIDNCLSMINSDDEYRNDVKTLLTLKFQMFAKAS